MSFLIAYIVIAASCIVISARTLISYTDCSDFVKAGVYILFVIAWFAPILIWSLQPRGILPVGMYTVVAKSGYFLFGFAFILVMLLIFRDLVWGGAYLLSGKKIISPNDFNALQYANYGTLIVAFLLSVYSVYSAERMPEPVIYEFKDSRINKPVKILMVSDIHITKMTPIEKVKNLVKHFNEQNPDMVLMVGDIADDKAEHIQKQIKELGKIKAPMGVFYTLGNHETYFDAIRWESEFASLGWKVLHNSGVSVEGTGLYVAGLPDAHRFSTNTKQAIRQAKDDEYRILLSHIPATVKNIGDAKIDLQVSGHTHGGQIFPFNFFAKWGNAGFVFGKYEIDEDTKLIISRGVGYWGPQMRLLAPNDMTIINLMPE